MYECMYVYIYIYIYIYVHSYMYIISSSVFVSCYVVSSGVLRSSVRRCSHTIYVLSIE